MKSWIPKSMKIAFATAAIAGAAAASTVKLDYDRTVDFSTYESWAWKHGEERRGTTLAETRIRRALTDGFTNRGFERVDELAEADFLVDYHAAAHGELRVREDFRTPGVGRDLTVDRVPVGTLVVDVFDAETGALVWRGLVSDTLARAPERAERKTAKAVTKLLARFPPASER
jgi:hypothetical protein